MKINPRNESNDRASRTAIRIQNNFAQFFSK